MMTMHTQREYDAVVAEREAARRWARAWKLAAKDVYRAYHAEAEAQEHESQMLRAEREAAQKRALDAGRWARVWKAKAKENRYWEKEQRESAKYWANQESDRLGQLLTAEAERDRLKAQVEAMREAMGECDSMLDAGNADGLEVVMAALKFLRECRAALAAQEAK